MKSYTKIYFEEVVAARVGDVIDIDLEPITDERGNHLWKINPIADAVKKHIQLIDESMRSEKTNIQRFSFKVLAPGDAVIGFHIPKETDAGSEDILSCTAKLIVHAQ